MFKVKTKRNLILFLALIGLSFLFQSAVAFATDPPQPVPDNFNVNQYLRINTNQDTHVPTAPPATGESGGAQSGASGGASQQQPPAGFTGFLVKVINLFTKIIASVALVVFIIGALLTIMSQGKEDRLEKGKNAMLYAIIGLLVAFLSFIIVTFVQSILY